MLASKFCEKDSRNAAVRKSYLRIPCFAEPKSSVKPLVQLQKAASGAAAAALIASSVLSWAPPPADASFAFSSSQVVAEKVTREGVYGDYEVDLPDQVYDDARSTFKSAKETKTKKGKFDHETRLRQSPCVLPRCRPQNLTQLTFMLNSGKYTALLAILIVGSFIIPMA